MVFNYMEIHSLNIIAYKIICVPDIVLYRWLSVHQQNSNNLVFNDMEIHLLNIQTYTITCVHYSGLYRWLGLFSAHLQIRDK